MSRTAITFNRRELAGSFGDIGTDFPLIVAMILAADLHAPSVLIVFGLMQVLTGVIYRMPMPVQPLKAMATIVITQQVAGPVLLGAGLAIGVVMLLLSLTGALDKLAKFVPKVVIRGLQLGLGISLCALAFQKYIPAEAAQGYLLAFTAFVIIIAFIDSKRFPAAILVIALGFAYAFAFNIDVATLAGATGLHLPELHLPEAENVWKGLLLLAIPQIPLSLGNSILATKQVSNDLFPERTDMTVKRIGLTYSFMNLVVPFFSGVPVCHGSGGMVGHYAFGGRTGGSVVLYGLLYLIIGVFFGEHFAEVILVFPLPILGVILLFEGAALMLLIKDTARDRKGFVIAVLVGVIAFGLPYGFVIALAVGLLLYYLPVRLDTLNNLGARNKDERDQESG